MILGRTRIMLGPGRRRAAKQDCRVQNYLPSRIKVSILGILDPFVNRNHYILSSYFLHSKSGHRCEGSPVERGPDLPRNALLWTVLPLPPEPSNEAGIRIILGK